MYIGVACCVTAQQPMRTELPQVATHTHGLLRDRRNCVLIDRSLEVLFGPAQFREFLFGEARQRQIDILLLERGNFDR